MKKVKRFYVLMHRYEGQILVSWTESLSEAAWFKRMSIGTSHVVEIVPPHALTLEACFCVADAMAQAAAIWLGE
jgi:hypothetical protein